MTYQRSSPQSFSVVLRRPQSSAVVRCSAKSSPLAAPWTRASQDSSPRIPPTVASPAPRDLILARAWWHPDLPFQHCSGGARARLRFAISNVVRSGLEYGSLGLARAAVFCHCLGLLCCALCFSPRPESWSAVRARFSAQVFTLNTAH